MKHFLLGLVFLILFSACSSTKVHFFTQGVEPTELQRISAVLEDQGFLVRLVELQPPELLNPTMIYSPALPNLGDIDRLRESLALLGYKDLDLVAVSKDNQSYTGRNVGLYLRTPITVLQADRNELQIPFEYAGHCDVSDSYLQLKPEGEFELKMVTWDKSDKELVENLSGTWVIQGEYLDLLLNRHTVSRFQIENSERTDKKSVYKKTQLKPGQGTGLLSDCVFVSTNITGK